MSLPTSFVKMAGVFAELWLCTTVNHRAITLRERSPMETWTKKSFGISCFLLQRTKHQHFTSTFFLSFSPSVSGLASSWDEDSATQRDWIAIFKVRYLQLSSLCRHSISRHVNKTCDALCKQSHVGLHSGLCRKKGLQNFSLKVQCQFSCCWHAASLSASQLGCCENLQVNWCLTWLPPPQLTLG